MTLLEMFGAYIFYYPIIMSLIWMIGGIYYHFRYERNQSEYPALTAHPLMSVLIPARNEAPNIRETVEAVLVSAYPNYEVIVINDASTDETESILRQLVAEHPQVRLLNLTVNQGKAAALNYGFLMSKGEIIVTVDADCMLDARALHWMAWHFINFPRVGALTGNPRVRNRTTLLAQIQTAEYASVIGLIKRTQRVLGKVLTVSGVIAAWRRQALLDVGLWSNDMITDDIDMTWKMEKRFWDVRYETKAIGWMLVPETFWGLWRQRCRWAQGGVEVIRRHRNVWTDWRQRRIWPLYIDYVLSIIWAHIFLICMLFWSYGQLSGDWFFIAQLGNPVALWNGSIIAVVCMLQFAVSLLVDNKYDKRLWLTYFWVIWYPVIYWIFNAMTVLVATPRGLTKKFGKAAIWASPDRGLRAVTQDAKQK